MMMCLTRSRSPSARAGAAPKKKIVAPAAARIVHLDRNIGRLLASDAAAEQLMPPRFATSRRDTLCPRTRRLISESCTRLAPFRDHGQPTALSIQTAWHGDGAATFPGESHCRGRLAKQDEAG